MIGFIFGLLIMGNEKIKILYTIPNFDTAGSSKVVYDLVSNLDRSIFEPEICCFHTKGDFFDVISQLGVTIHVFQFAVPYRPFFSFPLRLFKRVQFFKKHQFDLIHSWHWSSDFSEPLAAKLAGIPFVYTKKSMGWGNKAWIWRSRLSSKIITINSDMEAFFSKRVLSKVIHIPLGVDTDYYHTRIKSLETPNGLQFKKEDFIILSVVNFIPVKGLELLIQAVNELDKDGIELCFVGSATGDYADGLKSMAIGNPNIYFLGKQLDVRPYHVMADVFIIPTLKLGEGLPMAPMEAMASGLLVLGSRVPGVTDLLEPFEACLFEPSDVAGLKQKIVEAKTWSQEHRDQLGKEMRHYILKHFSKEDFLSCHESLYKQLKG